MVCNINIRIIVNCRSCLLICTLRCFI